MTQTSFSDAESGKHPQCLQTAKEKVVPFGRREAWLVAVLGIAPSSVLGAAGSPACHGPNCPGLVDGLGFVVGAFVLLNVIGALWMIGCKVAELWKRWRHPAPQEVPDPASSDSSPR